MKVLFEQKDLNKITNSHLRKNVSSSKFSVDSKLNDFTILSAIQHWNKKPLSSIYDKYEDDNLLDIKKINCNCVLCIFKDSFSVLYVNQFVVCALFCTDTKFDSVTFYRDEIKSNHKIHFSSEYKNESIA